MTVAHSPRDHTRPHIALSLVDQCGEQRGKKVHLDPLALSGAFGMPHRGQNTDYGVEPGHHVNQRNADLGGLTVREAGDRHQSPDGLS